jgi:hypothetical protein
MKRTIFVVISCLLLLGLVLAGCGEGGGYGTGTTICVWPDGDPIGIENVLSRVVCGLNWSHVKYTGTVDFQIPQWMLDAWAE